MCKFGQRRSRPSYLFFLLLSSLHTLLFRNRANQATEELHDIQGEHEGHPGGLLGRSIFGRHDPRGLSCHLSSCGWLDYSPYSCFIPCSSASLQGLSLWGLQSFHRGRTSSSSKSPTATRPKTTSTLASQELVTIEESTEDGSKGGAEVAPSAP